MARKSTDTDSTTKSPGRAPVPVEERERFNRDLRLNFLIQDAARLQKRAFDRFMSPLGLTRVQWLVVATLSRHDGMMQTQLASMIDVSKANLGAIIEKLGAAGLIERATHPIDGRAKTVFLSKAGHQLVDRMLIAATEYHNLVLGGLDDASRDQLMQMLRVVKRSLGDLSGMD